MLSGHRAQLSLLVIPRILLRLLLPQRGQGIRRQRGCARTRSPSRASCQAELSPSSGGTAAEFPSAALGAG